ncbi:hypothetical protein VTG60DRAFT_4367 [Thermothelomyces hinnuleus]
MPARPCWSATGGGGKRGGVVGAADGVTARDQNSECSCCGRRCVLQPSAAAAASLAFWRSPVPFQHLSNCGTDATQEAAHASMGAGNVDRVEARCASRQRPLSHDTGALSAGETARPPCNSQQHSLPGQPRMRQPHAVFWNKLRSSAGVAEQGKSRTWVHGLLNTKISRRSRHASSR